MPFRRSSPLLLACSCVLLASCAPLTTVYDLNFKPGPVGETIDPATLLSRQIVPADRLVSLSEAFARAPEGSVILTCWKDTDFTNFWGPCSHITRKFTPTSSGEGRVAETYNFGRPKAGIYPERLEYNYYAVIVLDTGVTPAKLPAIWAAARTLDGKLYDLSGHPDTYYCSTYQNALQRAAGLPDIVPYRSEINLALPADALKTPGVKVLWVGLNQNSPKAFTEPVIN
ncbi:hypothetical protein [Deinococcus altitudinis]|uniref:hypothetical protein n=1 Tax=Deinococcus altitudinis TaxID=468914 RepID=UPI003892B9A3